MNNKGLNKIPFEIIRKLEIKPDFPNLAKVVKILISLQKVEKDAQSPDSL